MLGKKEKEEVFKLEVNPSCTKEEIVPSLFYRFNLRPRVVDTPERVSTTFCSC